MVWIAVQIIRLASYRIANLCKSCGFRGTERYLKSLSKVSTLSLPGKISADANGKGAEDPFHWRPNKSFPITAVRNTAEWSFSKLRLIKTFHRSTMTDERQTNLAISIESETAKTLDMTELTKTFVFLKIWKKSFF